MKRWPGRTDPHTVWDNYGAYTGPLAFDIGANIGQIARKLAATFEQVVSFEPCEEAFQILNTESPPNVTALPIAVSDTDGEVTLLEAEESIKTGQLVSNEGLHWGAIKGKRRVTSRTLDSLVQDYGKPTFVKIDTEGHEVAVVRGGQRFLNKYRPALLIEIHSNENGEAIRQLLPGYTFEEIRQTHRPESICWGHYWLKGI